MLKPKMDKSKALMVMGLGSSRSLDPREYDTKAVLSEALDKKGRDRSRSNKTKVTLLDFTSNRCHCNR